MGHTHRRVKITSILQLQLPKFHVVTDPEPIRTLFLVSERLLTIVPWLIIRLLIGMACAFIVHHVMPGFLTTVCIYILKILRTVVDFTVTAVDFEIKIINDIIHAIRHLFHIHANIHLPLLSKHVFDIFIDFCLLMLEKLSCFNRHVTGPVSYLVRVCLMMIGLPQCGCSFWIGIESAAAFMMLGLDYILIITAYVGIVKCVVDTPFAKFCCEVVENLWDFVRFFIIVVIAGPYHLVIDYAYAYDVAVSRR